MVRHITISPPHGTPRTTYSFSFSSVGYLLPYDIYGTLKSAYGKLCRGAWVTSRSRSRSLSRHIIPYRTYIPRHVIHNVHTRYATAYNAVDHGRPRHVYRTYTPRHTHLTSRHVIPHRAYTLRRTYRAPTPRIVMHTGIHTPPYISSIHTTPRHTIPYHTSTPWTFIPYRTYTQRHIIPYPDIHTIPRYTYRTYTQRQTIPYHTIRYITSGHANRAYT